MRDNHMKKTIFNVYDYILELANFEKPDRYETYSASKDSIKNRDDILCYCDTILNFNNFILTIRLLFYFSY